MPITLCINTKYEKIQNREQIVPDLFYVLTSNNKFLKIDPDYEPRCSSLTSFSPYRKKMCYEQD